MVPNSERTRAVSLPTKIVNTNPHPWESVAFLRRLGPDPHANGAKTPCLAKCPDMFELDTGDFAVIGRDITAEVIGKLPPTAGCGPDERIVWIPRKTLVLAKPDIPDTH